MAPDCFPDKLSPFWRRKEELCIESECITKGCRVVIPEKLQKRVLDELHRGHPGVVRMKMQARNHVWWPELEKSIEWCASACSACQATKNSPARAPLHPWVWPTAPCPFGLCRTCFGHIPIAVSGDSTRYDRSAPLYSDVWSRLADSVTSCGP